jgi:phosphatidylserine/phosphatidylglycerophosphate/cardiolipin synthase-like enzyme
MGVKGLSVAVAQIALELHPERIDSVCAALQSRPDASPLATVKNALGSSFSPQVLHELAAALNQTPRISPAELAAMFRAASATASLVAGSSSVELVWTGPATGIVPIRHTGQVLTGLIDEARERIFLVSFVAYDVPNVVTALRRALDRGTRLDVLLEASTAQGGNVTLDSIALLKAKLPNARFFHWDKPELGPSSHASVHAKCAVADGILAFVTSANLSEAALDRNMEVGILVRGGSLPGQLDRHLQALMTTEQIKPV